MKPRHYPILHGNASAAGEEILDLLDQLSETTGVPYEPDQGSVLNVIQECLRDPISEKKIRITKLHRARVLRVGDEVSLSTKFRDTTGRVREFCEEMITMAGMVAPFEEGMQILTFMKKLRLPGFRTAGRRR